jgi:hypothetical protein
VEKSWGRQFGTRSVRVAAKRPGENLVFLLRSFEDGTGVFRRKIFTLILQGHTESPSRVEKN